MDEMVGNIDEDEKDDEYVSQTGDLIFDAIPNLWLPTSDDNLNLDPEVSENDDDEIIPTWEQLDLDLDGVSAENLD